LDVGGFGREPANAGSFLVRAPPPALQVLGWELLDNLSEGGAMLIGSTRETGV
jgi:hypothetical protein